MKLKRQERLAGRGLLLIEGMRRPHNLSTAAPSWQWSNNKKPASRVGAPQLLQRAFGDDAQFRGRATLQGSAGALTIHSDRAEERWAREKSRTGLAPRFIK